MRKVILILLVFISAKVSAQVYQEMPQYGYRANRMAFDSTLQIPTVCGVPTLKSVVKTNKSGAIAYDSCNARFYAYNPKTLTWTAITSGSADTTSLSNRINLKIDSLKRSNDSVYAWINGTRVFQFKDSVGGGGTTPNLQQVTTAGATTTNTIIVGNVASSYIGFDPNQFVVANGTESILFTSNTITSTNSNGAIDNFYLPTGIPSNLATIPISVNGIKANANGNITISTSGVAVDTIFRTLGKDSIFYKKNNITYAIKDSVGTNPAPVGYYGAFQDTTTQTAALINTAYGVKLGVTDLTNGVTVANNSKIKIANAGIYNIQFSLQLEKTGGSGNMIADIWLRKNNVNLAGTNGKIVLTGSVNASPIVAAWNYVVAVSSNDSLELMWATDNLNVKIIYDVATSPHPSTPSAILTVTQQSGIMAGTGVSPLDTANMLSTYLRKIDTLSLSNRINLKLNIADTSTMLSKYLRKTDTATLSNRINLKLNIADTSTLQPKSISSYTILANNTSATANATAQYFKDTSGTYTGAIAWNGTAPTGGNLTYRWIRIGKMVNINISLIYSTQGSSNSTLTVALPSDAPIPSKPAGLTSALNQLYPIVGSVNITNSSTLTNSATRGFLRNNTANNGFEFILNYSAATAANAYITCTYFTD